MSEPRTIGEVLVGSEWFMARWDKYHAEGRDIEASKRLATIDRLACPECGALAERIGHMFTARDGQEGGFEQETCYMTRDRNGMKWRGNEPGVVELDSTSTSESRSGAVMRTSKTVYALAITHVCPRCCVVFPKQWARPWRGEAS